MPGGVGFFCIKHFFSVGVTVQKNLWNLLLPLQELKLSEFSLMISDQFDLKWDKISFFSTMHILHCIVLDNFIQ